MKATVRIGGVLVAVMILIAIIPNAVGVPVSQGERLTVDAPPTLPPSEFMLAKVDPAPPIPAAPEVSLASAVQPLSPPSAPVPATIQVESSNGLPAEDRLVELRGVRRALNAQAHRPGPVNWDVYVRLPPNAAQRAPLRVLLVLHGMGGNGVKFASNLIADADKNGWVIVAPTLPYKRDYLDPDQLMQEDLEFGHTLHSLLATLPQRLGLTLRQRVLIFGFSRGAQLGHRFALFHPEHVAAVAAISAGSYTLPLTKNSTQSMAFPYGIADLSQRLGEPVDTVNFPRISFWIAVGEKDNRTADVSRAFDSYSGRNRVERAKAFASALRSLGMDVNLTIYPNVSHEVTSEMYNNALRFLRQDELADQ